MTHPIVSRPLQSRFLDIPQTPLAYWLRERFFELLAGKTLGDVAKVREGFGTRDDARFLRFVWEVTPSEWRQPTVSRRWVPFEKGGGYGKWFGHHLWTADWQYTGRRVKTVTIERYGNVGKRVFNEEFFFNTGWTYSHVARGSLGFRVLAGGEMISDKSPGVFVKGVGHDYALALNCRLASFVARSLAQSLDIRESYVARIPVPREIPSSAAALVEACVALKRLLVCYDPVERSFHPTSISSEDKLVGLQIAANLHAVEGTFERLVFDAYQLDEGCIQNALDETGTPAGWFPLLSKHDGLPDMPPDLRTPLPELAAFVAGHKRLDVAYGCDALRRQLRGLYEAGPGAMSHENLEREDLSDDDAEEGAGSAGVCIPIPAETFLEELSQKLELHPISVYWLLKEGIEREGWRCLPEERRLTRDRRTVLTLQLLGHRWPRQVKAGEPVPTWADPDGVIPLTDATGERTLPERMKDEGERMKAESGFDASFILHPSSFADLMGKPLDQWLTTEFFKHHTSQFKKRPIAWQIQSGKFTARKKPAFACLVYYHKLDGDLLPKLCKQYAGHLQQRLETELRGIEGVPAAARSDRQEARRNELGDQIQELQEFDARLREVQESAFATDGLRAAAIQDGLLCLKQAWLRRLAEAVRSGPLGQWVDAAREAAIHADLPGWIEVAMSQLDRHCTHIGPDDSQWDSSDELTPVTAAKFICTKPGPMVTEALTYANGCWAGQVYTVVISPLRQQISEKQERQKALKAELKASTKGDTTVHAIGELRAALDRLKIEIRDLQAQVGDIQGRCDRLRALITGWHCPGVDGWQSWLAEQLLFDAISSVDGRRRPPTTVQEWVAQEQSYFPDINDGVRVNIAPLQKAGLLAADVLAKKDLDKAIADRAEWRRDERRWVREGKLPRPGWWPEGKDEG